MNEPQKENFVASKSEKCFVSIRKQNGEMQYFECDSALILMATDTGQKSDGSHESDSQLEYVFSTPKHAAHLFEIALDFLYKTTPNLLKFQLVDFLKRNKLLVEHENGQWEFRIQTKRVDIEKEINP